MATPAQVLANQANARHSTGPRTEQGKARSSHNHLSHGLSSKEFILLPGEQAGFDEFMAALRDAIQPAGALEFDLFTQLAHASWALRRFRRAEARIQAESACPDIDPALVPETEARLRTLQIYAQRAERSYYRALKELKALQSARAFKECEEYEDFFAAADGASAAPLSEQHKVAGPRIALADRVIDAQRAQDEEQFRAYVEADPPSYDGMLAQASEFQGPAMRTVAAPPVAGDGKRI